MAYHFEFDSENQILRTRYEGRVTDEEVTTSFRLVRAHAARNYPRAVIADLSAVTEFAVAAETIRKLADPSQAPADPKLPRFIVAPTSPTFGMSRMFELSAGDARANFLVVRKPEEVWAFLSIREPLFELLPPLPE